MHSLDNAEYFKASRAMTLLRTSYLVDDEILQGARRELCSSERWKKRENNDKKRSYMSKTRLNNVPFPPLT